MVQPYRDWKWSSSPSSQDISVGINVGLVHWKIWCQQLLGDSLWMVQPLKCPRHMQKKYFDCTYRDWNEVREFRP